MIVPLFEEFGRGHGVGGQLAKGVCYFLHSNFNRLKTLRVPCAFATALTFLLATMPTPSLTAQVPPPAPPATPVEPAELPVEANLPPAAEEAPTPLPETGNEAPLPDGAVVEKTGEAVAETPRRFRYNLSVVVREVYDDNVGISQVNKITDFYTSIDPTIRLGFGSAGADGNNAISLVYSPSISFFANNSNFDSIQHVIHLEAGKTFGKLTLSLSGDVRLLDGSDLRSLSDTTGRQANVDLGTRSRMNWYSAKLATAYDLSPKTFLSGGLEYSRGDYASQSLAGSQNYSGNLFINFNYSPKLVLGLGGTYGFNETTSAASSAQTYEQVNLRVNYNPTEKLGILLSGGIEFRQLGGSNGGSYMSPVFDLTANYKPFDGTTISVDGSRRTQNSAAISGSDFAETDLHFTVQQRFFQRIFVSLSAGYQNLQYFSALSGMNIGRTDDYYYYQLAIDGNITRYLNAGLYYLHREDNSTLAFYGFSDNQYGFRASLAF